MYLQLDNVHTSFSDPDSLHDCKHFTASLVMYAKVPIKRTLAMVEGFSIKCSTLPPEIAIVKDWEIQAFRWMLLAKVRGSKHTFGSNLTLYPKMKVTKREWRHYLQRARMKISILKDFKNKISFPPRFKRAKEQMPSWELKFLLENFCWFFWRLI